MKGGHLTLAPVRVCLSEAREAVADRLVPRRVEERRIPGAPPERLSGPRPNRRAG